MSEGNDGEGVALARGGTISVGLKSSGWKSTDSSGHNMCINMYAETVNVGNAHGDFLQ